MIDLSRLRRPEYTGANRCRACTAVNVAVLFALISAVWLWMPLLAVAVGVVGTATIALRGYLIPFTPRFAPALVTLLPSGFFDRATPTASDALSDLDADDTEPEAVLRALVDAAVVITDGDRLQLGAAFEAAWYERMDALADAGDDRIATVARDAIPAVTSARVERTDSEVFLVVSGDAGAPSWIRRPVAIAELAATEALSDTDVPTAQVAAAANALCAFLETCPACGTEVVEGRLDDCCGHVLDGVDDAPTHGLVCETCEVAFNRFG